MSFNTWTIRVSSVWCQEVLKINKVTNTPRFLTQKPAEVTVLFTPLVSLSLYLLLVPSLSVSKISVNVRINCLWLGLTHIKCCHYVITFTSHKTHALIAHKLSHNSTFSRRRRLYGTTAPVAFSSRRWSNCDLIVEDVHARWNTNDP